MGQGPAPPSPIAVAQTCSLPHISWKDFEQKASYPTGEWYLLVEEQSYYRAKRAYFFRSNRGWDEGPWITWYTQRLVQESILPVLAKKVDHITMEEAKYHVVCCSAVAQVRAPSKTTTKSCHTSNNGCRRRRASALIASSRGPESGNPMWDTGTKVYKGCLLIGPHGGNMPNMMFLRPGCWVVEIGFVDSSFNIPTDFYCFARNLGLTYWLSVGDGTYTSGLQADLEDLWEIISCR